MSQQVIVTRLTPPLRHRLVSRIFLSFIVCFGLLAIVPDTSANPKELILEFVNKLSDMPDENPSIFNTQFLHTVSKAFPEQTVPQPDGRVSCRDYKAILIKFAATYTGTVNEERLETAIAHIDFLTPKAGPNTCVTKISGTEAPHGGNTASQQDPCHLKHSLVYRSRQNLTSKATKYPLEAAFSALRMLSDPALIEIKENQFECSPFKLFDNLIRPQMPWSEQTALEWEQLITCYPQPSTAQDGVSLLLSMALDSYAPQTFSWVDAHNYDNNVMNVNLQDYSGDLEQSINSHSPRVSDYEKFKNLIVAIDHQSHSPSDSPVDVPVINLTVLDLKSGYYVYLAMKPVTVVFDSVDHTDHDATSYTVLSGDSIPQKEIQSVSKTHAISLVIFEKVVSITSDESSEDDCGND